MSSLRQVEPCLDRSSWPNGKPPQELRTWAKAKTQTVDVADALLFLSWLAWPPNFVGCSLAECWAWVRYVPALAGTPDLRLRREWKDLDPHQKTVLSDDFGVGISASVLTDVLGFVEFADTLWALKHAYKDAFRLNGAAKRGKRKSPDYLVLDTLGRVSFIECKGTQTSRAALEAALRTGVQQKKSVRGLGSLAVRHRLAAGVYVPVEGRRQTACVRIVDPPSEDLDGALRDVPEEVLQSAIRRVSLGKQLAAAGMTATGALLANDVEATAATLRSAVVLDLGLPRPPLPYPDAETRVVPPGDGLRNESRVRVPPGAPSAEEAAVREVVYSTRVPNTVLEQLLRSQDITRTVEAVTGGRQAGWMRRSEGRSQTLIAPSGVELRLEFRINA